MQWFSNCFCSVYFRIKYKTFSFCWRYVCKFIVKEISHAVKYIYRQGRSISLTERTLSSTGRTLNTTAPTLNMMVPTLSTTVRTSAPALRTSLCGSRPKTHVPQIISMQSESSMQMGEGVGNVCHFWDDRELAARDAGDVTVCLEGSLRPSVFRDRVDGSSVVVFRGTNPMSDIGQKGYIYILSFSSLSHPSIYLNLFIYLSIFPSSPRSLMGNE